MTNDQTVSQAEWNAAFSETPHDPNCSAALDTGGPMLSCDCDRDHRAASLIVSRRLTAHSGEGRSKVTFVRCKSCGGEFDEGEWSADTRCPECEQPKEVAGKRTSVLGANPPAEAPASRLREALTPSAATKAAYMGEFSVKLPEVDENGDEYVRSINVPWTTIKEIMAAISARAGASHGEGRSNGAGEDQFTPHKSLESNNADCQGSRRRDGRQ